MHKHQQKKGASTLVSKVVVNGTSKRKNKGKDDHPNKKGPGTLVVDMQPSPKPSHGVGKMTMKGPIAQGAICRLVTQKDYVVEMVELIIKETDMDLYVEQVIKDLGASSLFDLSRV